MIKLENISAQYDKKTVIHKINLSIFENDFIAIIGPNGSGKSTLLKILAGQITPCSGTVFLNKLSYSTLLPKQLALHIAYYPQTRVIPNMRVQTLVSHGRFPHLGFGRVMAKKDHDKIQQALEITKTTALKERFVHTLSGGERQRAFLAMLIAQDTPIILLDEPMAYLDIGYQIEIMDILKKLNALGKTIVLVEHDLPSAFTFSKHIVVLNNGQIMANGSPDILEKESVIQEIFGITIKKLNETKENLLYPYVLVK